ncbi:MAG: hypothetical protein RBS68_16090 [Anaerolineales bacterium]|jgi:hypothetical protein|nr:hypothetical protein [Anaerolineales bacterium]
MDNEIDLQKELNKPVSELTRKFYNDILNAMDKRAANAKKSLDEIQVMLVEIAGIVDSEWMYQQRVTKMRDLRDIKLSELIPVVKRAAISAHSEKLKIMGGQADTNTLKAENKRLSAELAQASREREAYEQANRNQEEAIDRLTNQIDRLRTNQPAADSDNAQSFAEQYDALPKMKHGDQLTFIIEYIGERGEALSPDLRKKIAENLNLNDPEGKGRTVSEVMSLAEQVGIIAAFETSKGRQKLVELTRFGEYAFEQATGKKPRENDYQKEHKSESQVMLALEAQVLLEKMGYKILPTTRMFIDGHEFAPDITAEKDGEVIYAEVERNTTKANQNLDTKWRNYRHFSNGKMYAFVPHKSAINNVTRYALPAMKGPQDILYLCDISVATRHFEEKGTIWTLIRKGV